MQVGGTTFLLALKRTFPVAQIILIFLIDTLNFPVSPIQQMKKQQREQYSLGSLIFISFPRQLPTSCVNLILICVNLSPTPLF